MKSKILGLLGMALLCTPNASPAAILQTNGSGVLTGALGVSVNDTLYDVEFRDGTCEGLFNGCDDSTDFVFGSSATAFAASQALLVQVFTGSFDTQPWLIRGCESMAIYWCAVWTPYSPQQGGLVPVAIARNDLGIGGAVGSSNPGASWDISTSAADTYAVWTPSPVPIPAAAWLMLSGLAGLGVLGRRGVAR